MVHFGQYILANRVPGWEDYYIGYKILKKRIKQYAIRAATASDDERDEIVRAFSRLLDSQIEKMVLFLIEKQGLLAGRLQSLRERRQIFQEGESYADDTEQAVTESSEEFDTIPHLMSDYRQVGVELLQLLNFVELNAVGLHKILKKFDKRVGFRLGAHYIASRSNHPYSQLQHVFRQVGIKAMVATISRNLAELRTLGLNTYSSTISLYHEAELPRAVVEQEPIIQAIETATDRLTQKLSFAAFVAHELLLPVPKDEIHDLLIKHEDAHFMSIQLNLLNTFVYMVNYYIVVPSSDEYAMLLNAPASLCGVIIGSMPLAALVSAFVYSWWSNFSYKSPLLLSSLILMAGNFMYALALYFNSVWLLLIGRFLCGLGGARAINRRYISDHVPVKQLTSASAAFVSASALGMAAGPALAGFFNNIDFQIFGAPVNFVTAPGWLMGVAWGLYFILILLFFKEPNRDHVIPDSKQGSKSKHSSRSSSRSKSLGTIDDIIPTMSTPLLYENSLHPLHLEQNQEGDVISDDGDDSTISDYNEDKAVGNFAELMKELTLPIKILLTVYFMLKFTSEILISESSILTGFYFNWSTPQVGLFLGLLGLTVLPISAVVGNYISNIYEDRLVVVVSQVIMGVGVASIVCFCPWLPYTSYQYVAAAIVIFVSTNVLEGVNMSLLSKVMSPRLSRGVFNCGFLSTEAGTLARTMADGLITVTGWAGEKNLLNYSMIPTFFIVVVTTIYTWIGYFSLY
ncbi:hypothetical protein BDL97_15G068500 [Sphagnum fallax]|nr:hypothetical protein BDL97_15G068500 [Sphagnum fallax]